MAEELGQIINKDNNGAALKSVSALAYYIQMTKFSIEKGIISIIGLNQYRKIRSFFGK